MSSGDSGFSKIIRDGVKAVGDLISDAFENLSASKNVVLLI